MSIICLVGNASAGKTTAANMIKEMMPVNEVILALQLKKVCSEVFNVPLYFFNDVFFKTTPFTKGFKLTQEKINEVLRKYDIHIYNAQKTEKICNKMIKTPRELLQIVGTELLREVGGADIHLENTMMYYGNMIISDIRFINEFKYFQDNFYADFIPLFIQRDSNLKCLDTHSSEVELLQLKSECVIIDNNGSLEDLRKQLKREISCLT